MGEKGEFAAGNGAAMRIAPFAFFKNITREDIYNACKITHHNDEAYTVALAVYLLIVAILNNNWTGHNNLFDIIIPQLPDTMIRDRQYPVDRTIAQVAALGHGYAVNSVPLAIFAAANIYKTSMEVIFRELIETGGDTDSNCSIAGQIARALIE